MRPDIRHMRNDFKTPSLNSSILVYLRPIPWTLQQGGGSKQVQVDTRIAVTAESGDGVSSLEIPAENKPDQTRQRTPKKGRRLLESKVRISGGVVRIDVPRVGPVPE